jgi:hypothetical protein
MGTTYLGVLLSGFVFHIGNSGKILEEILSVALLSPACFVIMFISNRYLISTLLFHLLSFFQVTHNKNII